MESRVTLDVSVRTLLKIVAVVLATILLVRVLDQASEVLVWLGTALFLAVGLEPVVQFAQRRMRRSFAVITVFVGLLLLVAAFLALLIVPLATQIDDLERAAPGYVDRLQHDRRIQDLNQHYHIVAKAREAIGNVGPKAFGTLTSVATGVAAAITVIFLTLFLMLELPSLSAAVLSLLPAELAERVRHVSRDVNKRIGGYVLGNLIISVIAGTVVGLSLWILGVPYAAALAVLMGVFDLVPLVGATVGALAAIGVAFATQGVTAGIAMIVVNVVYQQVENHVLQPIVYRRTVELSAFVVLVAVLVGGALLGILGALVAIPIAGSIQVIVRELLATRESPGTAAPPAASKPV
jgi:predicted PurR-regulated permease PerM